jgi:hypothetical protein
MDEKYGKVLTERGDIAEDEPLFIIRGQDAAAVPAIRAYALKASYAGASDEFVQQVEQQAEAISQWQKANPDRVKVPD